MSSSIDFSFNNERVASGVQSKMCQFSSACLQLVERAFQVRAAAISMLTDAEKGWEKSASDSSFKSANSVALKQESFRSEWASVLESQAHLNKRYEDLSSDLIAFRAELVQFGFRAKRDMRDPLKQCQQLLEALSASQRKANHSFSALSKIWTLITA